VICLDGRSGTTRGVDPIFKGAHMMIRVRNVMVQMILLLAGLSTTAFAQSAAVSSGGHQGGIGVGIEGGISRNTLHSTDELVDFESRTGTLVGLWVGGNKNGNVGFVGEFLYALKKTGAGADEVKIHALEIPAVFHINFGSHSREGVSGRAIVGPVFTVNVKKTLKSGLTGDNFSSADVGLMAGAGIEAYRVAFEVRGNWGFKTVTDTGGGNFEDAKTRAIEVVLKFRFN